MAVHMYVLLNYVNSNLILLSYIICRHILDTGIFPNEELV